jgi:hypothetical protein
MRYISHRLLRSPILAFALLVGLTAAACSGSSTDPTARLAGGDSLKAKLVGSWTLVAACGGIAGGCQPLSAVTVPDRYTFRSDDSVEAYRGGQRRFTTNYMISPGATDPNRGDTRPVLLVGYGPAIDPLPLRVRFSGDTAVFLDEGCCDRYTFEYRRIR